MPMPSINFFVRGVPMPQPRTRARVVYVHGKPTPSIYDELRQYEPRIDGKPRVRKPWDAERWRERIIERTRAEVAMAGLKVITGPIRVDEDFYFPRPDYMLTAKYPAGRIMYDLDRNDRDNLDKLVLDAITQAGWREINGVMVKTPLVWHGDGQVCQGEPQRWWVARGAAPGMRIVIEALTDQPVELFEKAEAKT